MAEKSEKGRKPPSGIPLPRPVGSEANPVEEAIRRRRSVREYRDGTVKLDHVARLLWAGQGITEEGGVRAAPSAGGTYPLVLYLIAGDVEGLAPGTYRYDPRSHGLTMFVEGDKRVEVATAALSQEWIAAAPFTIMIAADYDRTTNHYGERGVRYVRMESGHVAQNVHLAAVALGLGSTAVAAFEDRELQELLDLPENEEPLYLIPVGVPR